MYDVTMTSFLCFRRWEGLKAKNVKLTSDWKFMFVFELCDPKLVSIQMADFSLFLGANSCEVPSVILLPWQQLKTQQTGLTCKMCLKGVSLKSESFSLIP